MAHGSRDEETPEVRRCARARGSAGWGSAGVPLCVQLPGVAGGLLPVAALREQNKKDTMIILIRAANVLSAALAGVRENSRRGARHGEQGSIARLLDGASCGAFDAAADLPPPRRRCGAETRVLGRGAEAEPRLWAPTGGRCTVGVGAGTGTSTSAVRGARPHGVNRQAAAGAQQGA